jgi:hypothetical protein
VPASSVGRFIVPNEVLVVLAGQVQKITERVVRAIEIAKARTEGDLPSDFCFAMHAITLELNVIEECVRACADETPISERWAH